MAKIVLREKRERRTRRTRARISGTSERPRLAVFRSNRGMYVQLIDDEKAHTLVSASSAALKDVDRKKSKSEQAARLGEALSEKALSRGIKSAVFDRRGYRYHGRVRALAEAARKKGLKM